ncbi:Dimodular nonribosomal peptide synthase [Phytophthora cinnamomi]|uniref:Dimodular nonribosomal peptide synthase n=1 Tax=Phytophthora cinnamomi TaxID=4785 RepID=UPI003559EFC5|nr:Dimodular nonribosomal peptide synthase [Phytophthora cinnamomi]
MTSPILFIIRGVPGGRLEQGELEEYPEGHFYTVQEKAWMDSSVWRFYAMRLLSNHERYCDSNPNKAIIARKRKVNNDKGAFCKKCQRHFGKKNVKG